MRRRKGEVGSYVLYRERERERERERVGVEMGCCLLRQTQERSRKTLKEEEERDLHLQ